MDHPPPHQSPREPRPDRSESVMPAAYWEKTGSCRVPGLNWMDGENVINSQVLST